MKQKVENTIPVYDICSLQTESHSDEELIVERFSTYLQAHPNLHIAHRHSFYHIVLFTEGSGYHTIDFEQFEVKAGQIYFMIPGQVHSWAFEHKVDGYIVNFSSGIFTGLFSNAELTRSFSFFRGIAADSVISLTEPTFTTVVGFIERMLQESESRDNFSKEMICAQLLSLWITVSRVSASAQQNIRVPLHNQLIFHNFNKLVEEYYTVKRLPKEYAALLYITANHLNALCQDLVGKSAGHIIRDRILLEAKRLLVNANLSISEIAYQLNFSDNSYFTKFFRKYTNHTPDEFRKSSFGL